MANVRFRITSRQLLKGLLACFALLLALHLLTLVVRFGFGHDYFFGFVPMFNFNFERNIPTMYTVLLFVLASYSVCWQQRSKTAVQANGCCWE